MKTKIVMAFMAAVLLSCQKQKTEPTPVSKPALEPVKYGSVAFAWNYLEHKNLSVTITLGGHYITQGTNSGSISFTEAEGSYKYSAVLKFGTDSTVSKTADVVLKQGSVVKVNI